MASKNPTFKKNMQRPCASCQLKMENLWKISQACVSCLACQHFIFLNNDLAPIGSVVICTRSPANICKQRERNSNARDEALSLPGRLSHLHTRTELCIRRAATTTSSPGLFPQKMGGATHFLREKPWGRGWQPLLKTSVLIKAPNKRFCFF